VLDAFEVFGNQLPNEKLFVHFFAYCDPNDIIGLKCQAVQEPQKHRTADNVDEGLGVAVASLRKARSDPADRDDNVQGLVGRHCDKR